jgi:hypothetical protein
MRSSSHGAAGEIVQDMIQAVKLIGRESGSEVLLYVVLIGESAIRMKSPISVT